MEKIDIPQNTQWSHLKGLSLKYGVFFRMEGKFEQSVCVDENGNVAATLTKYSRDKFTFEMYRHFAHDNAVAIFTALDDELR